MVVANAVFVPIKKSGIVSVPDRTIPRRPAHGVRKYFTNSRTMGRVTASPGMMEKFHEELPKYIMGAITIFLHEHCIFSDNDMLWKKIQKQERLTSAIANATITLLARREENSRLYEQAGGNTIIAAYLITALHWDEAVKIICTDINLLSACEKLTKKVRPRGGMPLYDEALRKISEIEEREGIELW